MRSLTLLCCVFAVTFATNAAEPDKKPQKTRLGVWGDSFVFPDGQAGIRLTKVDPASAATRLRILPIEFAGSDRYALPYRDVIMAVNGRPVTTIEALVAELNRSPRQCELTIHNRSTHLEDRFYTELRD